MRKKGEESFMVVDFIDVKEMNPDDEKVEYHL